MVLTLDYFTNIKNSCWGQTVNVSGYFLSWITAKVQTILSQFELFVGIKDSH